VYLALTGMFTTNKTKAYSTYVKFSLKMDNKSKHVTLKSGHVLYIFQLP